MQIFQLRYTAKTLVRQAKKCEKEEKSEKLKVKKAIEKGNMDGARIYAQNAIRKKNEQLNYLRLGSRLDGVVARLDTQAKMNVINKSMAGIVKSLDRALASNNMEQISQTMDQFEKQLIDLDVQSATVEGVMQVRDSPGRSDAPLTNSPYALPGTFVRLSCSYKARAMYMMAEFDSVQTTTRLTDASVALLFP